MEIPEIVELAINGKYDEAFSQLEKMRPHAIYEFGNGLQVKGENAIEEFWMHLSKEQDKKWEWLCSSQRAKEYLLSIPQEELTDQDWADLRAADF